RGGGVEERRRRSGGGGAEERGATERRSGVRFVRVAIVASMLALMTTLQAQQGTNVRLADVTAASGVTFTHDNGAAGRKLLPETLGAGSAFVDVDNDGDQDLIFVQGLWPDGSSQRRWATIYLNDGSGRFTDATAAMGLELSAADARRREVDGLQYGMGIAAADFDNDGYTDLALTSVQGLRLFRNQKGTRFQDVTAAGGLADHRGFSTCVMWVDYDRDGLVDLFVCNYVQWSARTDLFCAADGGEKAYCTPQ